METVIAIGKYETWDREAMSAEFDTRYMPTPTGMDDLPEDVLKAIRIVFYQGHAGFGGGEMDRLPQLKLISNFGVGYDSIDVDAARERGVRVSNTPGVLNDDVADLAVAMAIAQSRRMWDGTERVRSGVWAQEGELPLANKFSGKRVGIMGLGRIGRDIAERLAAFRMEIHYHSRREKETPGWTYHADPVSLAGAVDFLFVALIGGVETDAYVSAAVIEALGPDGILVNVSRGTTVDEGALLDALEAGRLRGAALDVYRGEPDIDPRFLKLDNALLLPHQGSGTIETRQAMGQLQRDNAAAFLAGRELLTPVV